MLEALTQGEQEIRLAESDAEIRAAQSLRYQVFYQEMGAKPSEDVTEQQRDFDAFDDVCEHLLVIDRSRGKGAEGVVGTYRLMRQEHVEKIGRFYTAAEYDISPVLKFPGKVLELGRSCVDSQYRTKLTMQLLWRGIAAYVFHHGIDLMFGCASLHGTDPAKLALPLSYLYHNHLAPAELRPRALPDLYNPMDLMPAADIHAIRGLASVPPLVKGYLRLGGWVGDGAVIDHQFNTTDVCVLVKTDQISEKYVKHYDRTAR
ncbi:GNAT family N-acetyltransferase [Insolitispirillum peregrinum]|uniref:L-ornithine N(alpha)-acyltransferase n=1 Tax=Insolitispirillum peregrinum TaxID=80876 RepID=A0A1N7MS29_9PROT|nr:GNAT family N-acyltransferase [Insolitispirillum peregrinum]SIS88926.1 ornithine-acyl[acyl carrier protein] N-acyltransferase [Insolitispirillum peregrinum]